MNTSQVLLIGNGMNNIDTPYLWSDLINDLIRYIGAKGVLVPDNKPFPLLYEEIYGEALKHRGIGEIDIKDFIAQKALSLHHNPIHELIEKRAFANILTTNYDYTIEESQGTDPKAIRNDGVINENVYSVFRRNTFKSRNTWHIHGEAGHPHSITLGYEHYAGYLQHLRNYVATGTGKSYKREFLPLIKRLKQRDHECESWVEFFFKKDIFVLGLTLDFVEMDLWWLITYRARRRFDRRANDYKITNKIIYFYREQDDRSIKSRLDLLRSCGVIPHPIPVVRGDWKQYYLKALEKIDKYR